MGANQNRGPSAVRPSAVPPFAVPPFAVPPFAVPPFAVPPFAVPPFAVPPSAVPPSAVPPFAVPPFAVRPMTDADWPAVRAIYASGIAGGDATFETEPPTWERFDRTKLSDHRLVAVDIGTGTVLGWIAVTPVSDRCVYGGVVEHSVYVDSASAGAGIGRALLIALITSTEAAGIWTIQSGVFPENIASLGLHERAGFRVVGRRERVGRQHGIWRASSCSSAAVPPSA